MTPGVIGGVHPPEAWDALLDALRRSPIVSAACARAGIPRRTAYKRRDADMVFRQAWDDAVEEGRDQVRAMLMRYAMGQKLSHEDPALPDRIRAEAFKLFCYCALPELRQRSTDLTSGGKPLGAPTSYRIDIAALTPEQRRRLIAGEPVEAVLGTIQQSPAEGSDGAGADDDDRAPDA